METREITNQELLREIKRLQKDVDVIRQMIYETNAGYFDTAQATNIDTPINRHIVPLTDRELLLNILKMRPVVDWKTRREKLVPNENDDTYLEWQADYEDGNEDDEI